MRISQLNPSNNNEHSNALAWMRFSLFTSIKVFYFKKLLSTLLDNTGLQKKSSTDILSIVILCLLSRSSSFVTWISFIFSSEPIRNYTELLISSDCKSWRESRDQSMLPAAISNCNLEGEILVAFNFICFYFLKSWRNMQGEKSGDVVVSA